MEPWHRILIRGIFVVIVGVAFLWGGVSLTAKLGDGYNWVGVVLIVFGVGLLLYSLRYFGQVLFPFLGLGV